MDIDARMFWRKSLEVGRLEDFLGKSLVFNDDRRFPSNLSVMV